MRDVKEAAKRAARWAASPRPKKSSVIQKDTSNG